MKTRKVVFIRPGKLINQIGLIIIFWGLSYSLYAQQESEKGLPFITNYSPKVFDAAPQTWCIIEDNRGIMYFGAQANILEYDGVKWKKVLFKTGKPPVVRSFAKDKNGRIYYGSVADFGYLTQDSLGQTINVSLINQVPKDKRNFFDVWTIYIEGDDIFFQSREYIFRLDKQNKITTWAPETKFMYAFYYDDTYYVHEQGIGLLKLNKDSLELIPGSEFLGQERMQVMLPYNDTDKKSSTLSKQYLVGLFYSGLFLFDGKTFRPFKTEADELMKTGTLYKGAGMGVDRYALSTTGKGIAIINGHGKIHTVNK